MKTKMHPSQMEPQGLVLVFIFSWQSESCKVLCALCVYSLVNNSTGIAYLSTKSVKQGSRKTPTCKNDAILGQLIMLYGIYLGEQKLLREAMPISLLLMWRAPWNITTWIFHDVSLPSCLLLEGQTPDHGILKRSVPTLPCFPLSSSTWKDFLSV